MDYKAIITEDAEADMIYKVIIMPPAKRRLDINKITYELSAIKTSRRF